MEYLSAAQLRQGMKIGVPEYFDGVRTVLEVHHGNQTVTVEFLHHPDVALANQVWVQLVSTD